MATQPTEQLTESATSVKIVRPGLTVDRDRLTQLCERWQVARLELFGSVLRDDFREDSDIDLLVTWQPGSRRTLFQFATMHDEFAELFGRRVDLVGRRSIEGSRNPLRRAAILETVRPFWEAG